MVHLMLLRDALFPTTGHAMRIRKRGAQHWSQGGSIIGAWQGVLIPSEGTADIYSADISVACNK